MKRFTILIILYFCSFGLYGYSISNTFLYTNVSTSYYSSNENTISLVYYGHTFKEGLYTKNEEYIHTMFERGFYDRENDFFIYTEGYFTNKLINQKGYFSFVISKGRKYLLLETEDYYGSFEILDDIDSCTVRFFDFSFDYDYIKNNLNVIYELYNYKKLILIDKCNYNQLKRYLYTTDCLYNKDYLYVLYTYYDRESGHRINYYNNDFDDYYRYLCSLTDRIKGRYLID